MTFYCPIGQELLNFVTNCCKLLKVNHCLPGARTGSFFYCNKSMGIFPDAQGQLTQSDLAEFRTRPRCYGRSDKK